MRLRRMAALPVGLVVILVAIELAARISGAVDFPIYHADNKIGYIPAPSQSGSFLGKNDWRFNSLSMGAKEFRPSGAIDSLLIGDSVVLGGNPYRENERLGPQLETRLKSPVWPISAGSWALRNALEYLRQNPDVVAGSDRFIFVLNSEDFGEASSWNCDLTHPRNQPLAASAYLFQKYVWNWSPCGKTPAELNVPSGRWETELADLVLGSSMREKDVAFVFYPRKPDAAGTTQQEELDAAQKLIKAILDERDDISYINVATDSRWGAQLYRDSIHPTVEGTRVLTEIIADGLRKK